MTRRIKFIVFGSIFVLSFVGEMAWLCLFVGVVTATHADAPIELVLIGLATNIAVMVTVAISAFRLARVIDDHPDPFGGAR